MEINSTACLATDLAGLAVLSSNGCDLAIFEFNQRKCQLKKQLKLMIPFNFLYNLGWKNANQLTAVQRCSDGQFALVEIDLESGQINYIYSSKTPIVYQKYSQRSANYQTSVREGVHWVVANDKDDWREGSKSKPMSRLHNSKYVDALNLMLCLTDNHQLFVNGQVLHHSVSSFSVVDENVDGFLLVTTLDSFLHAIPLEHLQKWAVTGGGRAIERGAQLVGHEPSGTRVWLQMPRGNLETIHPRTLLINRLKHWLDQLHFGKSLKEMRRHRINTNLIYDHNPQAFLSNITKFLEQSPARGLHLYHVPAPLPQSSNTCPQPEYSTTTTKVNGICQAVIQGLLNQPHKLTQLYPAVLTCFVVQKPSLVAQALSHMQLQLKKENGQADQLLALWLRHLAYLVDERTLFNQALKTYDLNIALKVAEASDRDPKEYLPILNKLRQHTPATYQRFQIDLMLEDWASALEHMAQECINHINTHHLHPQALALFNGHKHQQAILEVCAQEAFNSKCWTEACQLYLQANQPAKALECLCLQLDYQEYIQLASAHPSLVTPQQLQTNLKKMCVQLEARANYMCVAEILLYMDKQTNNPKILDCYCLAFEWKLAVQFAKQNSQMPALKTKLEERCQTLIKCLEEWKCQVVQHTHRLGVVRTSKQTQLSQWMQQEAEDLQDVGQSEVLSQTSTLSNASRFSKMSTASGRKKKQIERKKKQIKEVDGQQDEMSILLPALLALGLISQGQQVQRQLLSTLKTCQDKHSSIWPVFVEPQHLPGPLFEIYRCADGIVRMPVEGTMPQRIQIEDEMVAPQVRAISDKWRLKIFEILCRRSPCVDHPEYGLGQVFKEYLSANRQGTLVAGGLGSLVFTFALTAISNFKMANQGPVAKAGLFEAGIALLIAVIASGAIHRVAITICVLFSGVLLFFLNGISHSRYHQTSGPATSAQTQDKKKK
uniref:Dolichyl-diphosphooligosaccharide--protein glycosyltransferase subunit KCP2 n=1 Tax=Ditylenchus dipsaci TaxID=166011 RepID=A0A915DXS3_9BILA